MTSLWETVANRGASGRGAFHAPAASVELARLADASCLGGRLESLRGRSILLTMREQLSTALALLELDGVARRLVLCTPDLSPETLSEVAIIAGTGVQLADLDPAPVPAEIDRQATVATEWILLTSGTTGTPKLVAHTLSSLAGTLPRHPPGSSMVWSTFYDIRRYGGLQIYFAPCSAAAAGALESRRVDRGFSARAPRRRRDAHLGHALALAPRPDERSARSPRARVPAPLGRGRRSGLLDQLRERYPNAKIAPCVRLDRSGRRIRRERRTRGLSGRVRR